jgi:rhamnogalacturonyl hydrolase YesR
MSSLPRNSLANWSHWKGYTLNGFEILWKSTGDAKYFHQLAAFVITPASVGAVGHPCCGEVLSPLARFRMQAIHLL